MRRVVYIFLPDWPIDRLRRLRRVPGARPGEPGREAPFATVAVARADRRGGRRLAAINPAAAAAGLAPGMPLADALSFVPDLLTMAAEPVADAAALTRLAEWCGRYSPWTAPDGADGVKIEITGCAHLWGGEESLATDLARRLAGQGITARIAIASTPGAASALARFAAEPGRPAMPGPGEERAALAPLPVEALRLDPATIAGLRRVGLRRVGDLYPMPREALVRRFGEAVPLRLDQAFGAAPEPLSPLGERPVRQVRLGFAEPIATPADLARAIDRLAAGLTARLEREGGGARLLDLAFHRIDGRIEHIRVGTARPSRETRHLARLLAAKLETVDPGPGIEDMTLTVFAAERLRSEQNDLMPLLSVDENIAGGSTAPLLDRLGGRLGLEGIGRIAARESHIPERASFFVPIGFVPIAGNPHPNLLPQSPGPARGGEGAFPAGADPVFSLYASILSSAGGGGTKREYRRAPPGIWLRFLRPIRLFAPPEPVEAMWVLPDEPPFRFVWRHRVHRVRRAEGPERIAEEWWAEEWQTVSGASASFRDYYRVEDEEGRRFWLFRAGLPGINAGREAPRWFLHGVFA